VEERRGGGIVGAEQEHVPSLRAEETEENASGNKNVGGGGTSEPGWVCQREMCELNAGKVGSGKWEVGSTVGCSAATVRTNQRRARRRRLEQTASSMEEDLFGASQRRPETGDYSTVVRMANQP
jgi:hypothetical protein